MYESFAYLWKKLSVRQTNSSKGISEKVYRVINRVFWLRVFILVLQSYMHFEVHSNFSVFVENGPSSRLDPPQKGSKMWPFRNEIGKVFELANCIFFTIWNAIVALEQFFHTAA